MTSLWLDTTSVTDAGTMVFGGLDDLSEPTRRETAVTGAALKAIAGSDKLVRLEHDSSKVGDEGMQSVGRDRPGHTRAYRHGRDRRRAEEVRRAQILDGLDLGDTDAGMNE